MMFRYFLGNSIGLVFFFSFFFFFNDTATTEIYTRSLHDALPICCLAGARGCGAGRRRFPRGVAPQDRKSTRLNSSHANISYAVFCLQKKKHRDIKILLTHNQTIMPESLTDKKSE